MFFHNSLRSNPAKAKQYGNLKQLAKKYPFDIDDYVEGKMAFIISILERTGLEQKAQNSITAQNKIKIVQYFLRCCRLQKQFRITFHFFINFL